MKQKKLFNQNFNLVLLGQIISLFGNGIVRFALPLYLLNQTGSATLFGLVSALSFLPMILLMPIGGIIADRVNKRNVMVYLDFFTFALMMVLYLLLGKVDLVALLIVSLMLLFGIQGIYQPTVQASIPLLQEKDQWLRANAIINQVSALANLIAPIIGGIVFGVFGIKPIIIGAGLCFFLSAFMEVFISMPHEKRLEAKGILSIAKGDFTEAFEFIRYEKPIILRSIGIVCGFNLFLSAMLIVALPVLIKNTLGLSDQLYGFSQGALAAGGLIGGMMVGLFAKNLSVHKVYALFMVCAGLLIPMAGTLGFQNETLYSYYIISTCSFLLMMVATMVTIQLLTFIQGETPPHLIGKVISLVMAFSISSQPIGQALYGFLFDLFRLSPHYVVFGASMISFAIALRSKRIFARL